MPRSPWTVGKTNSRENCSLQLSLVRVNSGRFWQWLCNYSTAWLFVRILVCNMLALISSLCSPVLCQLVKFLYLFNEYKAVAEWLIAVEITFNLRAHFTNVSPYFPLASCIINPATPALLLDIFCQGLRN